jgi:hypothetical protein
MSSGWARKELAVEDDRRRSQRPVHRDGLELDAVLVALDLVGALLDARGRAQAGHQLVQAVDRRPAGAAADEGVATSLAQPLVGKPQRTLGLAPGPPVPLGSRRRLDRRVRSAVISRRGIRADGAAAFGARWWGSVVGTAGRDRSPIVVAVGAVGAGRAGLVGRAAVGRQVQAGVERGSVDHQRVGVRRQHAAKRKSESRPRDSGPSAHAGGERGLHPKRLLRCGVAGWPLLRASARLGSRSSAPGAPGPGWRSTGPTTWPAPGRPAARPGSPR